MSAGLEAGSLTMGRSSAPKTNTRDGDYRYIRASWVESKKIFSIDRYRVRMSSRIVSVDRSKDLQSISIQRHPSWVKCPGECSGECVLNGMG